MYRQYIGPPNVLIFTTDRPRLKSLRSKESCWSCWTGVLTHEIESHIVILILIVRGRHAKNNFHSGVCCIMVVSG